jgi:hypothetical protein
MNYYLTLDYFRYRIKRDSVLIYDKMKSYWDKLFNKNTDDAGYTLVNINKTINGIQQKYVSYDELWELCLENTLYLE